MPPVEHTGREHILSRIRTALTTPEPPATQQKMNPAFAPVTDTLERFKKECAANVTECFIAPDMATTATEVEKILSSFSATQIFVQDCAELRRISAHFAKNGSVQWSSEGVPRESTEVTITMCEALVAQSGSVLVSAACGGRVGSIIAPVHIVVARMDQLVTDLDTALAQVQSREVVAANSFLCLITGSSRTADIEKILVMGAHGPRRLLVFISAL